MRECTAMVRCKPGTKTPAKTKSFRFLCTLPIGHSKIIVSEVSADLLLLFKLLCFTRSK